MAIPKKFITPENIWRVQEREWAARNPKDSKRDYMADFGTVSTAAAIPEHMRTKEELLKALEASKKDFGSKRVAETPFRGTSIDKAWIDDPVVSKGTISASKLSASSPWPELPAAPRGIDRIRAALEEKRKKDEPAKHVTPSPKDDREKERGPEWGSW